MSTRFLVPLLLFLSPDAGPRAVAQQLERAVRPDTVADTTWYVTNRARRAGRTTRGFADSLEFGYVVTRFAQPAGVTAFERLMGRIHAVRTDSATLSREEFVRAIASVDARAANRDGGAVLYVHGFATSFGRAVSQSAEIAYRGSFAGPFIVFSWPAHTALATWPTLGNLISRAYRQDSAAAHASEGALREAIAVVRGAVRTGSLTVVGHSLGAQLLAEAIRAPSAEQESLTRDPLRALVFFAPDIAAKWFHDSVGPAVAPLAVRRVVYASNADRMLAISRMVNHTPRAGQAGAAHVITDHGVEVVDVTRGGRSLAPWPDFVDTRHAMRLAGAALFDFFNDVVRGQSVSCRVTGGIASRGDDGVYRLRPSAVTPAPLCAATATD